MSARLILIEHPMVPQLGLREFVCAPGTSVAQALAQSGWTLPNRTVLLNPQAPHFDLYGRPEECLIHPSAWHAVAVNDDAPMVLLRWPGKGQQASQIAGIVASIALTIFAPELGAFALGQLGVSSTATVLGISAARLATGVILIGGQAVISRLLPSPKPFAPATNTSPTYSISAQSNTARLGDKIPEMLGQNMVMLDLLAAPYVDYVDNQQRVMQLLGVSYGDVNVDEIRADKAVLWQYPGGPTGAYPEIEIEVLGPDDPVTLFPDNVFTSTEVTGQTVLGTNEADTGPIGPFNASNAGQYAKHYEVDLELVLYTQDDSGHIKSASISYEIEARAIDSDGNPTGTALWASVLAETLSYARREPVRLAKAFDTPTADRYQFRMTRTNPKAVDTKTTDVLQWAGLRAFLPGKADYPNQTKIAVRATGTANVNGSALQKINVIGTRKLPSWDAGTQTWTAAVPTSQIAAAALYICRTKLGFSDSAIDFATLQSLQETWTARGDEYNGVIDSPDSAWDTLQAVLRVGRTRAVLTGIGVTFVRDEAKTVPAVAFSPRNMLPSFNVDFNFDTKTAPDAIMVDFIDRRSRSTNSVLCALPGSTATIDTAPHVQIKGITDRSHAWREGMFTIADGYYRRVGPNFRTRTEGRFCLSGSLVKVTHWLGEWGDAADVIALSPGATVGGVFQDFLSLNQPWSRPDDAADDDANLIQFSAPDGKVYGPVSFDLVDDGETTGMAIVKLLDSSALTGKYAGLQPRQWGDWSDGEMRLVREDGSLTQVEPPRANLGVGEKVPQFAILQTMKPDGKSEEADVTTFLDDPRVHSADAGDPPAETGGPESTLGADLVITSIDIAESIVGGNYRVTFTVHGATDAATFESMWRAATATTFIDRQAGHARTFSLDWSAAQTVTVQVRAQGAAGFGPWFPLSLRVDGTADTTPADVGTITGVFATDHSGTTYVWAVVNGAVGYTIQKFARTNGSDSFAQVGDDVTRYTNSFHYYANDEIADGGPWHNFYIRVKAFNAAGSSPDWTDSDHGT